MYNHGRKLKPLLDLYTYYTHTGKVCWEENLLLRRKGLVDPAV